LVVMEPVTLSTERLALRFLADTDAPALFQIFSNAEVMRYWAWPAWTELSQARQMVIDSQEGYHSGSALQLGIERRADGVLVGTCSLFHFHAASRRAEIGYALGRPYWGSGYMHEALEVLLGYAFQTLDLNRLEADIDPRNQASAKTLERLGFQREGHLRERWIVNGEVSDTWWYGLLRREWQER
jgi:[ribosomal protein S5]-alanine N-acetyltransferase